MATLRLPPGGRITVVAQDPSLKPDQGLPAPEKPVDPGYGVDVGLGPIKPTHPIALPPPVVDNTLPVPPEPVDPGWGIDIDQGYVRPEHPIYLPPPPKPGLGWKKVVAWTPVTGWIVVAVPTGPTPTPSKK